ncbi:hypothetical protein LAUMK42_03092 [Mycobacterium persicum]|uniref:Uncharacterized protein n=1 Tax=Mycobacterium persicum TaxID=1487726 RepID=A0AB38UV31_9MYCO|nr:hypothetical protein LAUMK42_03092 [Mycobacterium persicum]
MGVFVGVERIDRRQRRTRIVGHRGQQPLQAVAKPLDAGGIEYICAVSDFTVDASGRPAGCEAVAEGEGQVKVGGLGIGGDGADTQSGQDQFVGRGGALPGQHDLDQRVMGEAAGGVEPFNDHLKGHVLVLVGVQAGFPDPGDQLGEVRVTGQADSQHHRIDEQPDHLLERGVGAPGNGNAHRDIGAAGQTGKQRSRARRNDHETGGAMLAGQPRNPAVQCHRPVDGDAGAGVPGHLRVGAVGGQLQPFRQSGQGLLPIHQPGGDGAGGVVRVTQLGTLPPAVIGVVQCQLFPAGGRPCSAGGVGGGQVAQQRTE